MRRQPSSSPGFDPDFMHPERHATPREKPQTELELRQGHSGEETRQRPSPRKPPPALPVSPPLVLVSNFFWGRMQQDAYRGRIFPRPKRNFSTPRP